VKGNSYIARNKEAMSNGSCYRVTGRKRTDRFAHYINGDFVGFTNEDPTEIIARNHTEKPLILSRREAIKILPDCFR